MFLFRLKPSKLALALAAITLGLHVGLVFLVHAFARHGMAPVIFQKTLKIYWPAFDLVRILGGHSGGGVLMGMVLMILAALIEWWFIYFMGIWLVQLYRKKPPIARAWRIAIPFVVLSFGVLCFKGCPETLGMSRYDRFRFDVAAGNIDRVKEALKQNPKFANQVRRGWGTALHEAAQTGHAEIAELLLEAGSDVNAIGSRGFAPLHSAAWGGKTEVAKVLIAHQANVNARDEDEKVPLVWAAGAGHTNMILLLLANGADVNAKDKWNNCPLSSAIHNNRYGVVPLLLSNGANPMSVGLSGESMLDRAALQNSPALAESLLPYYTGEQATNYLSKGFSSAITYGHMNVAVPIALAALRFESNSIFEAAFNGNVDGIRAAIRVNAGLVNSKDFLGLAPLHRAVLGEQERTVKLLLESGADINAPDRNGNTALHWAVFTGQTNVVRTLIAQKADVNVKGAGEMTALHLAVQQGFQSLAELLLNAGADPNIAASGGATPLCLAVANGNVGATSLLQTRHADFKARSYGETLFHVWADGVPNLEIADILLSNGCDINARGHEGKTPLHSLVVAINFQTNQAAQLEAVQWLLEHKAEINAKDDKGRTALSLLKGKNRGREFERRKDIGDLLRKYGAKG